MAISGTKGQGWRAIPIQYRKASDILTSTLAAFLFSSHSQESLALASMARDDPQASSTVAASSTASSTAPASSTAAAMRGKVGSEFET